jgi:hypothetical protein
MKNKWLTVQIILIILPILLWKYIKDAPLKIAIALFVIHLCVHAFLKIFENYRKDQQQHVSVQWFTVVFQLMTIFVVYFYSIRLYDLFVN